MEKSPSSAKVISIPISASLPAASLKPGILSDPAIRRARQRVLAEPGGNLGQRDLEPVVACEPEVQPGNLALRNVA